MILVERDRSAIKNLHEEEVMQVSGAPGQLRSNVQQFTVEPSPEWHAAGREVGLAPQICGARFLEIGSPNWLRSQVAFKRHFLWSEPAGSGASPGIGPLSERTHRVQVTPLTVDPIGK